MSRIYLPSQGAADWQQFLAEPEKQWKRGYSAMATALSWEAADGLPIEISALFDEQTELLFAIPEHKVALPGGARESQCDVFALVKLGDETCAMAVEAKVKEPFGPTMAEWLDNASSGKQERIRYICDLLGLVEVPNNNLRYQLFHRTAAAIVETERFNASHASMIVQSFSQEHQWFEDFSAFCQLFDIEPKIGKAYDVKLPSGMKLFLGWVTGSSEFL